MSKDQVKKIVKTYADYLARQGFPFQSIYLYGSYARGNAHEWSDIDVAVISPKFAGKDWNENEQQLWRWRRDIDIRIQPLGFSPNEFAEDLSPLVSEVKKTGIKIQ